MTQHSHTPPPDPMPLDPEERALAARLARLGPHGEPSPALDARVLAAAHAAATAHDARRARGQGWQRARWPVGVGVAASVVLAAGIAWQMRPLPAPQFLASAPASTEAAMTTAPASAYATAAPEAARPPSPARVMSGPPPQAIAAASAPGEDNAAATASAPAASDVIAAKSLAPPPPPQPSEPPVVFDAPSPVEIAAPPPAPPAPPAPVTQARQGAAASVATDAAQAQAAQPPTVDASDADAPEGDVPPATVASPAVRDAWLARIRELAATARTDEARASLAEFHRRYPAFAIPADLRHLLPAATPAPAATPPTTPR